MLAWHTSALSSSSRPWRERTAERWCRNWLRRPGPAVAMTRGMAKLDQLNWKPRQVGIQCRQMQAARWDDRSAGIWLCIIMCEQKCQSGRLDLFDLIYTWDLHLCGLRKWSCEIFGLMESLRNLHRTGWRAKASRRWTWPTTLQILKCVIFWKLHIDEWAPKLRNWVVSSLPQAYEDARFDTTGHLVAGQAL